MIVLIVFFFILTLGFVLLFVDPLGVKLDCLFEFFICLFVEIDKLIIKTIWNFKQTINWESLWDKLGFMEYLVL